MPKTKNKIWTVEEWADFDSTIERVAIGDVIHNPCYVWSNNAESCVLHDKINDGLNKRGMEIDHPSLVIGFVQKARSK